MAQKEFQCAVAVSDGKLDGQLAIPSSAKAVVVFAHGSGSGIESRRNQYIAEVLNKTGLATLLIDLLTPEEKKTDKETSHLRFDIGLLTKRLIAVTCWLQKESGTKDLRIAYFGSSTGAAAASIAASRMNNIVKTIVLRSGRIDLATSSVLQQIESPILLIVGGDDAPLIAINKIALKRLTQAKDKELIIIPGATHIFEEPGKIEEVAMVTADWLRCYLIGSSPKFINNYHLPKGFSALLSILRDNSVHVRFKDRSAAGEILTSILRKYRNEDLTVMGIARGGVIIADVIARRLVVDFDIIISRKLRSPRNSENALGAIMHDGSVYLDGLAIQTLNVSAEYLELEKLEQKKEIERMIALYRPNEREYSIKNRKIILVDDGAMSGATIVSTARWIRMRGPTQLIIALPVAPHKIIEQLKQEADFIEVLASSRFRNVGQFYRDYTTVKDEQVIRIMQDRQLL